MVIRGMVALLFAGVLGLIAAPFVVSSLYVDWFGVPLAGQVYAKRETVRVRASSWERTAEVTIQYPLLEAGGVSFFGARLDPQRFDELHRGQKVPLHYLRTQDLPPLPFAKTLGQMRLLPRVRMADQRAFSALRTLFAGNAKSAWLWVGALAILLLIWRAAGWPPFGWVLGIGITVAIGVSLIYSFPEPTPRPARDVRQGTGTVVSIGRIERLFDEDHDAGVDAHQAVDVVGVEFVPEGRSEPVVAVDLIDADSLSVLQERAQVGVHYEAHSPRIAYIDGATRTFAASNLRGLLEDGLLWLAVLAACLGAWYLIGRAYRGLVDRAVK